jgi:uncharacterized metal-binding protein
MNDFDEDYKETLKIMEQAKEVLSKINCKKCSIEKIWFNIKTDRSVEFEWCCDDLKEEIMRKLSNIGYTNIISLTKKQNINGN